MRLNFELAQLDGDIKFVVCGYPVAQGRPRFYRRGMHIGVYDPVKSKSWKESVRWQGIEFMKGKNMLNGALVVSLRFMLPRPKSLPKKVVYHVKKPDVDNLKKAVCDALKGICYKDDSQIIMAIVRKEYSSDKPGVEIHISEQGY